MVNGYFYKPTPRFEGVDRTKHLQMGFELEVTAKPRTYLSGMYLDNWTNRVEGWSGIEGLLYCKHDGSIGNGIELVSHPRTLNWCMKHKKDFAALFEALKTDFVSEKGGKCGYHIHCDRAFMGNSDLVGAKMALLVSRFWDIMLPLSRRTKGGLRWCSDIDFDDKTEEGLITKHKRSSRYVAVNAIPRDTVELRLWRGTLDVDLFLATMDLTEAIVRTAKKYSINTIQRMPFSKVIEEMRYAENKDVIVTLLNKKHLVKEVFKVANN